MYNAVARSHVCAAMDGYNAVIFAYGQTASGKTFTLVSLQTRGDFRTAVLTQPCSLETKISRVSSPAR